MNDLPDAPWIREAETNGLLPFEPEPFCPCCGREAETYYLDKYGGIIGCDRCVMAVDARGHQNRCEEE